MDDNDHEPRPEERPSLDTSTEEEEDEEDVKICVDMAALNVTRPHTQVSSRAAGNQMLIKYLICILLG